MHLDEFAFNRDELDSLFPAGIYDSSPGTLVEVWRYDEENHASQARGWTTLLFVWGRLTGWSEPAIRSISFFAGLLTLAWLYRAGRDLFAPRAGLFASMLTCGSLFFLSYMLIARSFTLIALVTTAILWSYWRLVDTRRQSGPVALPVFFLGCVGLLYSHYFTALILPALFLFHLLFPPRGRRWRQVLVALAASAAIALVQTPGFLQGLSEFASDQELRSAALDAARIPHSFLYFMSNFTLRLPAPAGAALLLLLFLALLRATWRRRRAGRRVDAGWLMTFLAGTTFLLMVAANGVVAVVTGSRIRYMISLLPVLALLAGEGLRINRVRFRLAVAGLLAFWLVLGPALLNSGPVYYIDRHSSTFHLVQRWLQERAGPDDLVVLESSLMDRDVLYLSRDFIQLSDQPWETVFRDHNDRSEAVALALSTYTNFWFVYQPDDPGGDTTPYIAQGSILCERMENLAGYTLERRATTARACANP